MGMNITDFLEARIAEDEAAANNATGARWVVLSGVNASMVNIDPTNVRDEKWKYGRFGHIATTSHDAAYAEHIARHDPARVLAECAAKRAIIAEHAPVDYSGIGMTSPNACSLCGTELSMSDWEWVLDSFPCPTLKALAAIYRDHPDYQEAWG